MSGIEEIPAGYQGLRTGQEALLVSPCCPDPALIVRGRPASLPITCAAAHVIGTHIRS
jgi:hypothetical protein